MTVREAARLFGVSASTIYRWIKKGELKAVKVGRRWKVKLENEPMDLSKWPVSNAALAFPVGMPSDVALLGLCDMPADTPTEGPGLALSMVKFQIHTWNDVRIADEASLPDAGKVRCVFGSKDLRTLWAALKQGGNIEVRVTAWPRFYTIKDDGSALLDGDDRGYHAGEKVRSPIYTLSKNEHGELLIDGKAEPKQVDPGPTVEEQAEIDRSDRIMREEREAHEAREREIKERAARENREHDERIERERREAAEADRAARAEADVIRRREAEEREREKQRAAKERERLGISAPGDVWKALTEPENDDSYYGALLNLWSGQYDPDQDGYKERLREIRQMDGFADAVDEVCRRLGWTL